MAILPEDDSFKRFSFYFISKESFFREGPTLLEFLVKGDTQFWRLWKYLNVILLSLAMC